MEVIIRLGWGGNHRCRELINIGDLKCGGQD